MADYPVTIDDARVSRLSQNEQVRGYTHKFKIKYTDIPATATASADTVTFTLGATPTRYVVDKAMAVVTTAFAGTTALSLISGVTGDTDSFIASTSVLTAGPINAVGNIVAAASKGTASTSYVAILTNATGGAPASCTGGELDIYLGIHDLDRLG